MRRSFSLITLDSNYNSLNQEFVYRLHYLVGKYSNISLVPMSFTTISDF